MADWSGLYLLAEVCVHHDWVLSAPLIPLDFPKRKRSLISSTTTRRLIIRRRPLIFKISQTVLGKRCHFKVDDDDADDFDGYGDDRKGKKKMKQSINMMGSDIASTSYSVVDHRAKDTETAKHLMMELGGPNPNPNPNPPRRFMDGIQELGGTEVKFLIQKTLSVTDLTKGQNRLSMPCNQIQTDFLTPQEKMILTRMEEDGKHHRGMEVMVIEPCLDQSTLCLKKWNYTSSSFSYVLIKNWFNLAFNNRLEPGMKLQIWSFRVNGALCFALVNLS